MAEDALPPLPTRHTWDVDHASLQPYDLFTADQLRAYAAQAVAQERERAARICESVDNYANPMTARDCADAIRAGSPSPQPPAIPAGWRLVPEMATIEMLDASWSFGDMSRDALRNAWRDMLAAAPQPPSAWRPISEAPRDGTDVLLYCSHGMYVACWWEHDIEWWHVNDNKHGPFPLRGPAPTHWQPLPPPPSAGEEKADSGRNGD